ncbi:hypothetical protein WCE55_07305 [Luteimonas sp. MJ293]|uniref:hypothetical protein n=1 Tax=Luteimonas sp. MJ146 TaxID=3129240 RepID=UPI0031BA7322
MKQNCAMKKNYLPRLRFWLWVALFGAYSVTAVGVMVHALVGEEHDSLSQVAVTSVDSTAEARIGGAAQLAAVYRAQSGTPFSALPPGSTFKVIWPDGSSEYVTVVSQSSKAGVQLLPDTQLRAGEMMTPAGELQAVPAIRRADGGPSADRQ